MTLINDVIDISKIEEGKINYNPESFPLEGFLQGLLGVFHSDAERKNLDLSWVIQPDAPGKEIPRFIHTDPRILRQILINLVGNAVKFTDQGEVKVSISFVSKNRRGAKLRFSVHDTGPGIAKNKQRVIFGAFEQLETDRQGTNGTGLGLCISGHLIKMLGGQIKLKSNVGKGSEFFFDIFLREGSAVKSPLTKQDNADLYTGYKGKRRKILIVDDMPLAAR